MKFPNFWKPGALSFCMEKPGRVLCLKEQSKFPKYMERDECVPFETFFFLFFPRDWILIIGCVEKWDRGRGDSGT